MLSAFNPHEMSERTVRAVATGREQPLAHILRVIRTNLAAEATQHLILSAPRGYGKSFLMRHVEIEAKRIAREEGLQLAILLMPEEMPFVKLPETLIHELTRTLTGGAASEAKLAWSEDEDSAFEQATRELQAAIREKVGENGLCVAMVENFDLLLKRAFPKEPQRLRLRAFLATRESQLMLIAASTSGAFDRDYDSSLFHAFDEVALEPWSLNECLAFFDRQRGEAGKPPFTASERARAKAVASFIGGTPRLATLLGDLLIDEDVLRAAELLRRLVDELTPFYKERIEALPGRSQLLLDALLRGGEPATQSDLAQRVNAGGQNAIAGPFHDLMRERVVTGVKATGSAEVLYRVSDRVFAHYYRFRVIEHGKALCPLEALVELLAEFFDPDQKRKKASEFIRLGRFDEARILARLADADRGESPSQRFWVLYGLEQNYAPRHLAPRASEAVAAALFEIAREARAGALDRARARLNDALAAASRAADRVVLLLARSRLDAFEGFEEGLAAAEEALEVARSADAASIMEAELGRCWSLIGVGRYNESLEAAQRIAKQAGADRDQFFESIARRYAGYSLARLSLQQEAIEEAQRAAALAHDIGDTYEAAMARCNAAYILGQLSRHEEAIEEARRATALAHDIGDTYGEADARHHTAYSLVALARHEEAIEEARHAAALAHDIGDTYEEAVPRLRAAYSLGKLSRHEEAIDEARRAATLARQSGTADVEASALFQEAYALHLLSCHAEAAACFSKAAGMGARAGIWDLVSESYRFTANSLSRTGRATDAVDALARAARVVEAHRIESEETLLLNETPAIGRAAGLSNAGDPVTIERIGVAAKFHAALIEAKAKLDFGGIGVRTLAAWLRGYVDAIIEKSNAPKPLDTLADVITIHFPDRFAHERRRLTGAAAYHRAGRARSALERLDPDFAQALAIMHPPAMEAPPGEGSSGGRRKGKRRKGQ